MNILRRHLSPSADHERGSVTPALVILAVAFLLFVGLVVDGGGKLQAADRANQIAQSVARAAANSINGNAVATGDVQLDGIAARNVANSYIAAAGVEGSAYVVGDTVTVNTTVDYKPIFLFFFSSLPGHGTASAKLIDG